MNTTLKNIGEAFRKYYESPAGSEVRLSALKEVIEALSGLKGEADTRRFAADFIGSAGYLYDQKVIEQLVKDFRLNVGPGYRFMLDKE
jgi:putative component of toxin-antitoxin plasmid stabilization module